MSFRLRLAGIVVVVVPAFAGTNTTIVVSAPRLDDLDLMAVETAADVTVISRKNIEDAGAVSVPDLLRNEANVLVRGSSGNGNDGQLSMRGFGDNAHLRSLVLVDGHMLNRPDMQGVTWQSVPVSNIERIEVVRGGQSVLYGDRAVGGVVRITTKRGADAGTRFGGSIGSFGYLSGSAGRGGAVGDLDYYVGVDGSRSDGFRSNSASRAVSEFASMVGYAGDSDTFSFRVSHTGSEVQFPGALDYEQMMQDPRQSNNDGSEHSDLDDLLATLIWESEQRWGVARIGSGISRRDLSWVLGGIDAKNRQLGMSLGPRIRWGSKQQFVMGGADLAYDTVDFENVASQDFSGLRLTTSEAELDRFTVSPYLFAQKDAGAGFLINGGVRYEHARTDVRNRDYLDRQLFPTYLGNRGEYANPLYQPSPGLDLTNSYSGGVSKEGWAAELSLVYESKQDWSAWVGVDRVYRYPVLDEMAAYQGYSLSDPLNERLDPETGNQAEIGWRGTSGEWTLSGTGYYLAMDNEIVFVEDADTGARLNTNLGATRRYGLEGEVSLDRGWYGGSTRWTLQDARLHGGANGGNRVPLVPWNHGVFSVWFKPDAAIRVTLSYSCVSAQYQGNDEEHADRLMDAYGLLDCRVNVAMSDTVRVEVALDNLLDETYAALAYGGSYYPGAGRSFRTGLSVEF